MKVGEWVQVDWPPGILSWLSSIKNVMEVKGQTNTKINT